MVCSSQDYFGVNAQVVLKWGRDCLRVRHGVRAEIDELMAQQRVADLDGELCRLPEPYQELLITIAGCLRLHDWACFAAACKATRAAARAAEAAVLQAKNASGLAVLQTNRLEIFSRAPSNEGAAFGRDAGDAPTPCVRPRLFRSWFYPRQIWE